MQIGIDLGTTYCCVAALDERGRPTIVRNGLGETTTPSVVWFDGHEAFVGRCAYDREREAPGGLADFVKRDMGKPPEIPAHLYDPDHAPPTAPYSRAGTNWGVVGMQALLLRRLRRDALAHFRQAGRLPDDVDDDQVRLDAVITIPAYFKDVELEQTRRAGDMAGLHVVGIVNEPTAAALAYRLTRSGSRRVFVFDLGGGTFDVTVIDLHADGEAHVLASEGNPELGGKDWDDLIYRHLRDRYTITTGHTPPDALDLDLHLMATAAKIDLSQTDEVTVSVPLPDGGTLPVTLYRAPPPDYNPYEPDGEFYFEQRAAGLLALVEAICKTALEAVDFQTSAGVRRTMMWTDLDEVIMVGGSCRMPMVASRLTGLTGKPIRRHPEGFDFDTAVATGAALYADQRDLVRDVSPGTFGIKLRRREDGRFYDFVQPLIHKNTQLEVNVEREYQAGADAVFYLYQGESDDPEECVLRGRLELNNPEGQVRVHLRMDREGALSAAVAFAGAGGSEVRRTLSIQNELFDGQTATLAERVRSVALRPCGDDHDTSERVPTRPLEAHRQTSPAPPERDAPEAPVSDDAEVVLPGMSRQPAGDDEEVVLPGETERLDAIRAVASALSRATEQAASRLGDQPLAPPPADPPAAALPPPPSPNPEPVEEDEPAPEPPDPFRALRSAATALSDATERTGSALGDRVSRLGNRAAEAARNVDTDELADQASALFGRLRALRNRPGDDGQNPKDDDG